MTQQEILKYNKRCANFLNWKYLTHQEAATRKLKPGWWKQIPVNYIPILHSSLYIGRTNKDLRFHSDWNLIMKVVEEVEKLKFSTAILDNGMCITGDLVIERWGSNKKEGVVETIDQFLIWYEQNKTV